MQSGSFFELMKVVDDAGKKTQESDMQVVRENDISISRRTNNLFNHLEAKHPIAHTKAVPREYSTQKQTTLGVFAIPPVLLLERIESYANHRVCRKRL